MAAVHQSLTVEAMHAKLGLTSSSICPVTLCCLKDRHGMTNFKKKNKKKRLAVLKIHLSGVGVTLKVRNMRETEASVVLGDSW